MTRVGSLAGRRHDKGWLRVSDLRNFRTPAWVAVGTPSLSLSQAEGSEMAASGQRAVCREKTFLGRCSWRPVEPRGCRGPEARQCPNSRTATRWPRSLPALVKNVSGVQAPFLRSCRDWMADDELSMALWCMQQPAATCSNSCSDPLSSPG